MVANYVWSVDVDKREKIRAGLTSELSHDAEKCLKRARTSTRAQERGVSKPAHSGLSYLSSTKGKAPKESYLSQPSSSSGLLRGDEIILHSTGGGSGVVGIHEQLLRSSRGVQLSYDTEPVSRNYSFTGDRLALSRQVPPLLQLSKLVGSHKL
jgi:hypothetical protein